MSFFKSLHFGNNSKKKEFLLEEANIFIQVHYVRERGSAKYAFNTLSLKDDPERTRCEEWYEAHNNPTDFLTIVDLYTSEKGIKESAISSEYNLNGKIFNGSSHSIEKWEAVSICLGLHLNISEARALLKTVDYALTNSSETDLIIRYCIEHEVYHLSDVNYLLQTICERTLDQIATF